MMGAPDNLQQDYSARGLRDGICRAAGVPLPYLVLQLQAFKEGSRRNDGQMQMRNVARAMTQAEIDEVAAFYAGKTAPAGH
jgi:cytochrome c553